MLLGLFQLQNDVYYESARAIQPHSDTYPYTIKGDNFTISKLNTNIHITRDRNLGSPSLGFGYR